MFCIYFLLQQGVETFFDVRLTREKNKERKVINRWLVTRARSVFGWSTREVSKGTRGMPRLSEAMKDAISCEKLRGLAHTR
jgi:hypothetical protein